ncbi:hypothetical protein Tco_1402649 [Tanacetum coccineum]
MGGSRHRQFLDSTLRPRERSACKLHEHDNAGLRCFTRGCQIVGLHINSESIWTQHGFGLAMEDMIAHQDSTELIGGGPMLPERSLWLSSVGIEVRQFIMSFRPTVSRRLHTSPRSRHIRHSYSCRVLLFKHSTRDMRREMGDMQAELLALREQHRRARQPGPDVRVPEH